MTTTDLNKLLLFFDESGKNKESLNLIGGLMIPHQIFISEALTQYNKLLLEGSYKMHWTSYAGSTVEKERILNVIHQLMMFKNLIGLNIIIYDKISEHGQDNAKITNMIYSKFPERIFYGLLRFYQGYTTIGEDIYIEDDSMYRNMNLTNKIKDRLNIQATYRGEGFEVKQAKYKGKNQIIGLELVDALMGIVKSIIENDDRSAKKRAKNELIVELLKDKNTYNFFENLKIFKWNNTRELDIIEFNKVLSIFLNHRSRWIDHLVK